LKTRHITTLMTHLNSGSEDIMETQIGISSIMDTWIALFKTRTAVSHTRLIEIIKARGMNHCEESRRFLLTDGGILIREIEDALYD
ncbi:MAG: ATPase domain-containing protein, partial [Spirochaetia bacterium]